VTNNTGAEAAGGGDIITRERYSNFELLVDFKTTPGCNSGIKYFVQPNLDPITGSGSKTSVGSAIGYEYQILDDAATLTPNSAATAIASLAPIYDLLPVDGNKNVNPIGEWNTPTSSCAAIMSKHWLNGGGF